MAKQDLKEAAMKKAIGLRFKQFRESINKNQDKLAEELHKMVPGELFLPVILSFNFLFFWQENFGLQLEIDS